MAGAWPTPRPKPPSTGSPRCWPSSSGDRGINAYNVDPGYVDTERQQVNAAALGLVGHYSGAPPSVPAATIAWLVEHPEAVDNGQTVKALKTALTHGLHPDWRPADPARW